MKDKHNILVVDDDPAHRTMLRTLLAGWGYSISEADDGSAAIERVHERAFDLILMDIRMIKVSGLQALDEIKSFNPSIPIIIMTAYSSVDTAVQALKNGAYDYLTKPLDFDELRLSMERAMEHKNLKEENRALRESLGSQFDTRNIIGRSRSMLKLLVYGYSYGIRSSRKLEKAVHHNLPIILRQLRLRTDVNPAGGFLKKEREKERV